jgi:hypothetical protein
MMRGAMLGKTESNPPSVCVTHVILLNYLHDPVPDPMITSPTTNSSNARSGFSSNPGLAAPVIRKYPTVATPTLHTSVLKRPKRVSATHALTMQNTYTHHISPLTIPAAARCPKPSAPGWTPGCHSPPFGTAPILEPVGSGFAMKLVKTAVTPAYAKRSHSAILATSQSFQGIAPGTLGKVARSSVVGKSSGRSELEEGGRESMVISLMEVATAL